MNPAQTSIPQATLRRAALVFDSVTGRIERVLGASWLPGTGKQLLDEIRDFCKNNSPQLGQRQFAIKLHVANEPVTEEVLTPKLIAELRKAHGALPLIEVGIGLEVVSSSPLTFSPGDMRNAVTDASQNCAIFLFENDRLCSIWAGTQLIKELIPSSWLVAGAASNRNWELSEYNEAAKEHYRRVVKYGQNLNHWADEKARILKPSDPPKHGTTEAIFHSSLLWWLKEHMPPQSVSLGDGEKNPGDVPDIIISGFNIFYVVEVKWLGTNGSTPYTWNAVRSAIRQADRYGSRPPYPEGTSVMVYDGRNEIKFAKFKDHLSEDGIAEFEAFDGEEMPTNGICHVFYLYSGSASQNAKIKK